jgi:tetratricopeptide (TPR) repeat protein
MASNKNTTNIFNSEKVFAIIISIFCFILYANTINHGYVLDDFSVISENTVTTKGISAIPDILTHFYRYGYYNSDDGIYRPLSVVMFAIEWTISPNNPTLSHFVNVLLYILSGFLLFKTLKKLLKEYDVIYPFIITLLFVAHPVHTEVIANIKSRDELLSFLLIIASLNSLLVYIETNDKLKLIFSSVFLFGALLSKETAISMIIVFPIAIYMFTNASIKSILTSFLGFAFVTVVFLLIRESVLNASNARTAVSSLENLLLAAPDKSHQIATAIKILGNYLFLIVFPNDLIYDRSFNQITIVGLNDISFILSLLVYLTLAVWGIIGIVKKNAIAFGIIFYLASMILFSNLIFTIGVAMADRFLYFSSFGFCFSIGFLIIKLLNPANKKTTYKSLSNFFSSNKQVMQITCLICILYSIKTIARNGDWKDNFHLYSADISKQENNAKAHLLLGNELIKNIAPTEQDKLKRDQIILEGITEIKKSLSIYPNNVDAWNTIGGGYLQIDSVDQAANYFEKASKTNPDDLSNLAGLYLAKQEYYKAIELFEKVLVKSPDNIDVLVNVGICYGTVKQYGKAVDAFNKAVVLSPGNPQLYYYLSTSYKFNGDSINYEKYYQEALKLDPTLPRP